MKYWIDRILILGVFAIVVVLVATVIPWIFRGHLSGGWLLAHMTASGALVFGLPTLAIFHLWPNLSRLSSGATQRLGFWGLLLTGWITIATVFLCMLPIPSTDQMHDLMRVHAIAGFAMVPAMLLLVLGAARRRRARPSA